MLEKKIQRPIMNGVSTLANSIDMTSMCLMGCDSCDDESGASEVEGAADDDDSRTVVTGRGDTSSERLGWRKLAAAAVASSRAAEASSSAALSAEGPIAGDPKYRQGGCQASVRAPFCNCAPFPGCA